MTRYQDLTICFLCSHFMVPVFARILGWGQQKGREHKKGISHEPKSPEWNKLHRKEPGQFGLLVVMSSCDSALESS